MQMLLIVLINCQLIGIALLINDVSVFGKFGISNLVGTRTFSKWLHETLFNC